MITNRYVVLAKAERLKLQSNLGKKLVNKLHEHGQQFVAASPNAGVNTITGEGLAQALVGTRVVVAPFRKVGDFGRL